MKATLEFDLNIPEEAQEHLRAIKSRDMAIVLFKIQHKLFEDIGENKTSIMIVDRINDFMYEHNVNLDELID